jgi:hypothetical protein
MLTKRNIQMNSTFHPNAARFAPATTTALTVITAAVAISTPPLSGPWCQRQCFHDPYLDIASRFPRDYFWMFPAILQAASFLFLLVCIHEFTPPSRKVFSMASVAFGVIASGTLMVTYFTQLAVIQPSLIRGETDGISMLTQFNSHGLFIALEELGYLMMLAALALAASSFTASTKSARVLRWVLRGGFALGLLSLSYFLLAHGHQREYFYEIAVISISWLTLVASGPMIFKQVGPFRYP